MKKTNYLILGLVVIMVLFTLSSNVVNAEDGVKTTTASSDAVPALTSEKTTDPVDLGGEIIDLIEESGVGVGEDDELVGIEVEEPLEVPSAIGLFWRRIKENTSLVFTFNSVKKAEKRLKYAAESMRIAEYIAENSDDVKTKKRATDIAERAQKFVEKIEDMRGDIENNPTLLKNIARYKVNKERILDKIEYKLSPEQRVKLQELRDRAENRDQIFLDGIINSENVSEEVKSKIIEKRKEVMERRKSRRQEIEGHKELIERAKEGDKDAVELLKEGREKREEESDKRHAIKIEEKKKELERIKNILEEKVQLGDKEALEKLNRINKKEIEIKERNKQRELFRELREKIKEGDKNAIEDLREFKKQKREIITDKIEKRNEIKSELEDIEDIEDVEDVEDASLEGGDRLQKMNKRGLDVVKKNLRRLDRKVENRLEKGDEYKEDILNRLDDKEQAIKNRIEEARNRLRQKRQVTPVDSVDVVPQLVD